ncbi:MAG: hypothetical protein ABWX84_05495 [Nocardioides sp.]
MSEDNGRTDGPGNGDGGDGDEVGSLSEEAVKLLGALSGWARTHGGDLGQGLSDIASAAMQDVDEHIATGAPECRYCPVCRVVHVVRDVSPEVRTHLMMAGANLMQAAAALMATAVQDDKSRGSGGVERIDLDDDWPEDS